MLTRRVDRLVLLRIATIGLSLERGTGEAQSQAGETVLTCRSTDRTG